MSEPNCATTAASAVSSTSQASVRPNITPTPPANISAPTVDNMHLDSAAVVGKVSLPYDVSVQLYRHRPQCTTTTVLPNVQPIVIQPYPNGAVQNDAKFGTQKTALKRSRLDDDAIDIKPQFVAKSSRARGNIAIHHVSTSHSPLKSMNGLLCVCVCALICTMIS